MEEKKQIRKLILIVCGVTAAVLLVCLAIRIGTNRLPEESGVAVYYTWLEDSEGRNYRPLSAGGKARSGAGRQKIWRSFEEYEQEAEQYWHEPQKPLSVWTWSEKIPGIDSFLVGEQGGPFFFSVKERMAPVRQIRISAAIPPQSASLLLDMPRRKTFLDSDGSCRVVHNAYPPKRVMIVQKIPHNFFIR